MTEDTDRCATTCAAVWNGPRPTARCEAVTVVSGKILGNIQHAQRRPWRLRGTPARPPDRRIRPCRRGALQRHGDHDLRIRHRRESQEARVVSVRIDVRLEVEDLRRAGFAAGSVAPQIRVAACRCRAAPRLPSSGASEWRSRDDDAPPLFRSEAFFRLRPASAAPAPAAASPAMPPLAMAAPARASWSEVTPTSCPMASEADRGRRSNAPRAAAARPIRRAGRFRSFRPNPNLRWYLIQCGSPTFKPIMNRADVARMRQHVGHAQAPCGCSS